MSISVLGIGGSLRERSHALEALQIALSSAAAAGAQTDLIDLRQLQLPLYDDRAEIASYPAAVVTLLDKVRRADGLILSTPVYHGTLSGALKNLLDFLEFLAEDDPPWLKEKVAGLISVAGGRAGDTAILSMEYACRALHAWTLPLNVAISGSAFAEDGTLQDSRIEDRLSRLGREVAHHAALLAAQDTLLCEPVT